MTNLVSAAAVVKVQLEEVELGSILVAYLVRTCTTCELVDTRTVIEAFRQRVPHLMVPRVKWVKILPLKYTGKIDRKELELRYLGKIKKSQEYKENGQRIRSSICSSRCHVYVGGTLERNSGATSQ
jgi:acyl-coenzyme A synthetase/AMP-(fatty) acid ligase